MLCSKWEPFRVLPPLLHHMVPLNDGNCCLTMPAINRLCPCDALPHTFNIGMFKSIKNSATIKHIYNEPANIIEGCNVAFDTNDCWNFPWTLPVIGIEGMATCACLPYTWDYLTPRIHYCDVIMGMIASQITSLTIVYSTVYSGADQRKHQSSESLAFVRGIHRGPVNSLHEWPVTRKMFPFDEVMMHSLINSLRPSDAYMRQQNYHYWFR